MYTWKEKLRYTWKQNSLKFSLESRDTTVLLSLRVDSMLLDQNVKTLVLRLSFEVRAWHNSTNLRSADEVDVMVYLQTASRRTDTNGSDRCTSSCTACTRFLSEPEASADCAYQFPRRGVAPPRGVWGVSEGGNKISDANFLTV